MCGLDRLHVPLHTHTITGRGSYDPEISSCGAAYRRGFSKIPHRNALPRQIRLAAARVFRPQAEVFINASATDAGDKRGAYSSADSR